ncbi:S4 domain-containing protein YaaA [Streptococcus pneumoniae]|nr:S4 domain-containing protein YaaA [Streptococcus pneumoniae]
MEKNLRIGDKVDIPDMNIDILLTQPTSEEQDEYQADKVEKERIAKLVKKMNKGVKKDKSKPASSPKSQQAPRFPGR